MLTHLKLDPELADIPVILLSIVNDRKTGFALGATEYLTKPLDPASGDPSAPAAFRMGGDRG